MGGVHGSGSNFRRDSASKPCLGRLTFTPNDCTRRAVLPIVVPGCLTGSKDLATAYMFCYELCAYVCKVMRSLRTQIRRRHWRSNVTRNRHETNKHRSFVHSILLLVLSTFFTLPGVLRAWVGAYVALVARSSSSMSSGWIRRRELNGEVLMMHRVTLNISHNSPKLEPPALPSWNGLRSSRAPLRHKR